MKRIIEESSQNVNSNAGIFLVWCVVFLDKQILDTNQPFGKFDSCQLYLMSVVCQTYPNSRITKTEIALMTLGKTSFCDIADRQNGNTLKTGFELDDGIGSAVDGCGLDFIVKRNARRENERTWIEQANGGEHDEPSYSYYDEKDWHIGVFRCVVSHLRTKSTAARPLFCVWEAMRMRRDDELLPKYSTATWWANLPENTDTVVRLYHNHATCEQFHCELKTDMDVERLPSWNYKTNSLILALSTLAFNVLRHIGQTARQIEAKVGEKRPERIRLHTVNLNLMYVAAINGRHGESKYLRLEHNCHRAKTFQAVFRWQAA